MQKIKSFKSIQSNYKVCLAEYRGEETNSIIDGCIKMSLPESSYKQIQKAIQVFLYKAVPRTTKYKLIELKKDNRVQRVGGRKDGYWEVIDE